MATPIWALAAAILRSASATSGRLSSSVEGTPARHGRDVGAHRRGLKREFRRLLADQHGDRVLEERALDLRVDLLRLARQQLRLGAHDIGRGGDAELDSGFR